MKVAHIADEDRIIVSEGDIIGIHYDSTADDVTGGIIPYEDSRHPSTQGVKGSLSAIYNSADRDSALPLGTRITLEAFPGVKRMPALKALVGKQSELFGSINNYESKK